MNKIKDKVSSLKLSDKFSLIIVIFAYIPLVILLFYFNYVSQHSAVEERKLELEKRIISKSEEVDKHIDLLKLTTQVIHNSSNITDYLYQLNMNEEPSLSEKMFFQQNDVKALEKIIISNPYLKNINIFSNSSAINEMYPILYGKNKSYYNHNITYQNNWFFSKESPDKSSPNELSLVSTIDHNDTDVGISKVSIATDDIFPELYNQDSINYDFIYTNDGRFIGDLDRDLGSKLIKEFNKEIVGIQTIQVDNKKFLVLVEEFPNIQGKYYGAISITDLSDRVVRQQIKLIVFSATLFLVLIYITRKITESMLTEMYEIFSTVDKFSQGDLTIRTKKKNQQEMDVFSKKIDFMFDEINLLIEENVRKEITEKNAQIKALQSQINAHFIFNVLETLKMMAEINEEFVLSDAITSLGSMMHYSMNWDDKLVTIQDEISYVENYLALMLLRLDNDIDLIIDIESQYLYHEIPKMTIQPMIENAILHGINDSTTSMKIKIKVEDYNESLHIIITDYGIGMSQTKLHRIKQMLDKDITNSEELNGIGLRNVHQRIKIIYGQGYGIDIFSEENEYTTISILIPNKLKKDK